MSRRWVVNASPLIVLARIGRLDLVWRLSDELAVPTGVADEVAAGSGADPAAEWLRERGADRIVDVGQLDPLVATWDLGRGESEVLTWAHQRAGWESIVDDGAARKCGAALGIPIRGTLGIILLAKREGLVPAARPLLERLVEVGYRIDPAVLASALKVAGEGEGV